MNEIEDLQKAIFNTIPDMAWLKDRKSRYIAVNEAYIAACGLKEHEILSRNPLDIWPTEWAETYLKTDQEVIRTGKRKRYEEWRYDQNGKLRWFDTIKTPFRNLKGEIIGTAGISRDITQRKEAEENLARFNRFYAVRSQTNQIIARTRDRQVLFYKTCKIIVQNGGLKAALIGLFNNSSPGLDATSFYPGKNSIVHGMKRLLTELLPDDLAGFRRHGAHALICNHSGSFHQIPGLARFASLHHSSSFALFPLVQGKKPIGILFLFAKEEHFFSEDIVLLLSELTADLSFALNSIIDGQRRQKAEEELFESRHQLRELSAFLQKIREEERSNISRELHDELGQTLTALTMGLQWTKKELLSHQSRISSKLDSLIELTQATTESVRRIASDLRPLMLDELGLEPAIEWLIETFSEQSSIQIEFKSEISSRQFSSEINTALFRILQESLTNVSRHGEATQVSIDITETGTDIQMRVKDNGCGIQDIGAASKKSLGLIGMRERAYMLGGTFSISSQEKAGTMIEVIIPKISGVTARHD